MNKAPKVTPPAITAMNAPKPFSTFISTLPAADDADALAPVGFALPELRPLPAAEVAALNSLASFDVTLGRALVAAENAEPRAEVAATASLPRPFVAWLNTLPPLPAETALATDATPAVPWEKAEAAAAVPSAMADPRAAPIWGWGLAAVKEASATVTKMERALTMMEVGRRGKYRTGMY